jgi:hypothetical protein
MIEQVGTALRFHAFFVASKVGKASLADVTVDVRRNGSLVVTGAAAVEEGGGLYYYDLAGASNTVEGSYTAVFKTADVTVDQRHVPALWLVQKAGVEFLDASIAARTAGLIQRSEPPTVGAVADQVWDEALSGHAVAGSAGAALTASGSAGDPLTNEVPGSYAQGTAGFALGRIGRGRIDVMAPLATSGLLTLVRGDDYSLVDGRAIEFTSSTWPDLTGLSEARLTIRRNTPALVKGKISDEVLLTVTDVVASRVLGSGEQLLAFELPASQTADLDPATHGGKYDVQATVGGRILTLVLSLVTVKEDQTR